MTEFITSDTFENRLREAVTVAWQIFCRKVGGGLISINKEASMQLQYAYVLKQLLPLIIHNSHEYADIELETGAKTITGRNNIDILLRGQSRLGESCVAIEMKCYRDITATGGKRGAYDIFMKDVYEDLHVLEEYVAAGIASRGVALVMCDHEYFVAPKVKGGKCWAYDISDGHVFSGGDINIPIGGKQVSVSLQKHYEFKWSKFGNLWFSEIEGRKA